MQARYYDPVIGRFYSNDPLDALGHLNKGDIHGFNRYAYANNNSYKYTDPDGLDSYDIQSALKRAANGKGGMKIDSIEKGMAVVKGAAGALGCSGGPLLCGAGLIQLTDASRELSALEKGEGAPDPIVEEALEEVGVPENYAKPIAETLDAALGANGVKKGLTDAAKNLVTQPSMKKVAVPLAEATTDTALLGYDPSKEEQ